MLWRCQFPELAKPGPRACGPGFFFDRNPRAKKEMSLGQHEWLLLAAEFETTQALFAEWGYAGDTNNRVFGPACVE
jgi:hypothetical protein